MNKFSLKSNNDKIAIFWRRVLLGFGLGLVLIFAGQSYWLWLVTRAWPGQVEVIDPSTSTTFDRTGVNQLLADLQSRPERLLEVLATTTAKTSVTTTVVTTTTTTTTTATSSSGRQVLVDPSL